MNFGEFIRAIELAGDDERYVLWKTQYDRCIRNESHFLEEVEKGSDGILKLLLIRFLSQVAEEVAVKKIVRQMLDANATVSDAARKSYIKNRLPGKAVLLAPALKSPHKSLVYFAVEEIGLNRVDDCLPQMIALLNSSDEVLFLKVLTTLRHIAKMDIVVTMDSYVTDKRDEVRLRVLMVFSALYQAGHKKIRARIRAFKNDSSAQVRRAVVWSLSRRRNWFNKSFFMKVSRDDPSPDVRQEAVAALGDYFDAKMVEHLLLIMTHDPDRYVVLRAESVLIDKPFHSLSRGLKKSLKARDHKISAKAVLLFAGSHKGSVKVCHYLIKRARSLHGRIDQVPFIESLGVLASPTAIDFLKDMVFGSPLVSYAATVAIGKIWRQTGGDFIYDIIADSRCSFVSMQVLLKQLMKSRLNLDVSRVPFLRELLKSGNMNVRYLAGQVLGGSISKDNLLPFLDAYSVEKEASVKKSFLNIVITTLVLHSDYFKTIAHYNFQSQMDISLLFEAIQDFHYDNEDLRKKILHELVCLAIDNPLLEKDIFKVCLHWINLGLIHWIDIIELMYRLLGTSIFKILLPFLDYAVFLGVRIKHRVEARSVYDFFYQRDLLTDDLIVALMGLSRYEPLLGEIISIASISPQSEHASKARLALKSYIQEEGRS